VNENVDRFSPTSVT